MNPSEKEVYDKPDKTVEEIAKAYSIGDGEFKTDEKDVVIFKVSYTKTFQTLQTLWLFEEKKK